MEKLKRLITKLEKFYWSPRLPETYVLPGGQGLGRIAGQNYAAFNLVWATHRLESEQDHLDAVKLFARLGTFTAQKVGDCELQDWITLQTPTEFAAWYTSNRHIVNPGVRPTIEAAINAVGRLQAI